MNFFLKIVVRLLKKNEFESIWLRKIFSYFYGIDIGVYSYGCFDIKRVPRGTKIGRYCSFASTGIIFARNHGLQYMSLHPYLYNSTLGVVKEDLIPIKSCVISDDVWLGHNSIILPGVNYIGRGAVIGAGAVVTKDVPAYAVVAGSPAKIIKYRFSKKGISAIENSHWWEMEKDELSDFLVSHPGMCFRLEINN